MIVGKYPRESRTLYTRLKNQTPNRPKSKLIKGIGQPGRSRGSLTQEGVTTVGEVCSRGVVIVHRNEALIAAAKLMLQHHVGDGVVVEEQEGKRFPVEILTDRDLVSKSLPESWILVTLL